MHQKRILSNTRVGKAWKKIMYFLNEEDSFLSLLANIVLAFIFIKFIVYPGLGLILGTQYPIVAVVSGSMEHDGSFDYWWDSAAIYDSKKTTQALFYEKYNITREEFQTFSFRNGFNTGDIMILTRANPEKIEVGQVVVFRGNRPDPIIHRVIEKNIKDGEIYLKTKGDHNPTTYAFESNITQEKLIGVARIRVPLLGWVKIIFVKAILCVADFKTCFS